MGGIVGEICSDPKGLKRIANRRRKKFEEQSVPHSSLPEFLNKGWTVVREFKSSVKIRKSKPPGALFEDQVWDLFYRMGFHTMNEDRQCNVESKEDSYQIQLDVLAKDDNNILVIECQSSEGTESINARDKLETWNGRQNDVRKAVQERWKGFVGKVTIAIALSSANKRAEDAEYAAQKGLLLWLKTDLDYLSSLA